MIKARIVAVLTIVIVIGIAHAFELNGFKWPGSHPRIPVYVSTSLEGTVPYDGTFEEGIEAIINAMNGWNQ